MSNNAINHNIKLVVKNGVPYVNMNFNSLTITSLKGYLKNLSYYASGYEVSKTGEPSGTLVPATVNSLQKFSNGKTLKDDFGTDYPNDITFPLCEEALEGNNEIPLQVFVPIMDAITPGSGKQNVYLRLDYSTLRLRRLRQILLPSRNRLHRPSQLQLRTARTWFPKNTVTRHSPLEQRQRQP